MSRDDRTWETEEELRAKETAEKAAKKAGKKVTKEAAKKAGQVIKKTGQVAVKAAKGLVQLLAKIPPQVWLAIAIIVLVVIGVAIAFGFVDKAKQAIRDILSGNVGNAERLEDLEGYDNNKRRTWNFSTDPDHTYLIYEKLKDNRDGTQTVDRNLTENLNDLMRVDTVFFSPDDMLDIL